MVATNGERNGTPETPAHAPAGAELFAQFQETTRLLLETQQAQNRVLERYLETQERLLLHCSANGTIPVKIPSSAPSAPPPVVVARTASTSPRVRPPVPVPIVRPSPVAAVNEKPINGTPQKEGPPPTETFRRDLLDIVSARTGYPIDALDENLALEAELGIDSIKKVEIFSKLKAYHVYFRAEEQAEEELLTEFTRLKTLRDIIDSYERRRQGLLASPPRAANGVVERYVVTSVPAPPGNKAEKKNGRTDSFS